MKRGPSAHRCLRRPLTPIVCLGAIVLGAACGPSSGPTRAEFSAAGPSSTGPSVPTTDPADVQAALGGAGPLCSLLARPVIERDLGRTVEARPLVSSDGVQACGYPKADGAGYDVVIERHPSDQWDRLTRGGTSTRFGAMLTAGDHGVRLVMRGIEAGRLTVVSAPCCTTTSAHVAEVGRALTAR